MKKKFSALDNLAIEIERRIKAYGPVGAIQIPGLHEALKLVNLARLAEKLRRP